MAEDSGRAFANLSEMRMRPSPMMSPEQARAYRTIMLNSSLKPSNSPVTANLQGAYSSGPRGSQLMVDPSMSANLGNALTVGGGYRTGPMGGAHGRAEIKLPAGLRALLEGSKSAQRTAVSAPVAGGEMSATLARMAGQGGMPAQMQGRVGYRTPFANGGGADANGLPPEQDESMIDMATRYGQGVMRKHPVITRGLTTMATDPLDLLQWLATHGVDPEIAAKMTREEMQDYQKAASSIPNASELANKYLTQAGVRESETLPEQIAELGVSMLGPAMLAKAPFEAAKGAFSWGAKILGKADKAAMRDMPRMAGGAQRGTIDLGPKGAAKIDQNILNANEAVEKTKSKLDYSYDYEGKSIRNHSPQQDAAVVRAENKLSRAIRQAYPDATPQDKVDLYTRLQELDKPILEKASGGPVHMGKGGLLKAGAEELVELAAKYLPEAEKVIPHGDPQREANLARHMEGSKAPPVLYTGTSKDADFKKFNVPKNGTWFTTNPKNASDYAMTNDSQGFKLDDGFKYTPTNTSSRVIPVHLNAKNPKVYDPKEHNDLVTSMGGENYKRGQRILYDKLRQAGHDSVRIGDDTWVALGSPNQIKSAVGNRGTFDPTKPDILKSHGGPVHMGKGGLLKAGAEELVELAAKYLPKQKISSAETSLKQVPALFKKIEAVPGQRNFDIGGGKYDLGTNYLSGRGVESHVYDPFNRSPEHNAVVLNQFKQSPADSTTVANVLNVIKEPEIRKNTIQMSYDFLKPGGKAHFSIYEGSGKSARSGIGRVTRKGWQNNAPATKYEQELKSVFGDNLVRKGNTFIGEKPVADVVKAPQRPIRKASGGLSRRHAC